MSTNATLQVVSSSLDIFGLTVATASRSLESARHGTVYDSWQLAAGQPVWFQPLPNGKYLALFAKRLTNATPASTSPLPSVLYTTGSINTAPTWAVVDPASGGTTDIAEIPSRMVGTRNLTAAIGNRDYLFTLSDYQLGDGTSTALVQHFRIDGQNKLTLVAEEVVPRSLGLGLYADKTHLWIFGDDGSGALALARKNWGRIGSNSDPNPNMNWQFRGRNGWYSEPIRLAPLDGPVDGTIPAQGPCTVARYEDNFYLMATTCTTHPATVTTTTTTTSTVAADVAKLLKPIADGITAILSGVLNGFIAIAPGPVAAIVNLLAQGVSTITGQTVTVEDAVTTLVGGLLNGIAGTVGVIADPISALQDALSLLSGNNPLGQVLTTAQDYLQGTVNTILGLGTDVLALNPTKLFEDLIRAITGIATGTGNSPSPTAVVTKWPDTDPELVPEPTWTSTVYTTRKVDGTWTAHGYTWPIAPTTATHLEGGGYLQPQIPLTPGFGNHATAAAVTTLDVTSDQIQVFTGHATHTVILPPVAKLTGSTVTTGAVETPITPTVVLPVVSIAAATITEGQFLPQAVRFTVTLDKAYTSPVTVRYATANGTATSGQDYYSATGTISFAPGIIEQQITVIVQGDLAYEPDETFTVVLSSPANATLGTATAICTIVNDDQNTVIESLLANFQSIVNGVIGGTIRVTSLLTTAVATLLGQATQTLTGVAADTGALAIGAVDQFLNLISGGLVDIPGDYGTPADNLANILALITTGAADAAGTITELAANLYATITESATTVLINGVVGLFQNVIGAIFGGFGAAAPQAALLAATGVTQTQDTVVPTYMPYTIYNQSRADIIVMASSRDKPITVRHGTGLVFTPYALEPTHASDWSWTYSDYRAPRIRQGYPFVTTRKVFVNTYRVTVLGDPTVGSTFRLSHNGYVTTPIAFVPTDGVATSANMREAAKDLKSAPRLTVKSVSETEFDIQIVDDCQQIEVYAYRLLDGTEPTVTAARTESIWTLDTRWEVFEPNPQSAELSGVAKAAASIPITIPTVPTGLPDLLNQFVATVGVATGGIVAVGSGLIDDLTTIITDAVAAITGQAPDTTDGTVTGLVTQFLQHLESGGATTDAATSFENILRQLTGGTGTIDTATLPSPLDFVTSAVQGTLDTLAEWLQQIINAITGK